MTKMTRAEYLTARGWTGGAKHWRDHLVNRDAQESSSGSFDMFMICTAHAVIIQRARDAEEQRRHWVAFASSADRNDGESGFADTMLVEYRTRFAVDLTDEPPAGAP